MALNDFDDLQCIQFNIPFHKDCPDFSVYTKKIRQIQEETETDLQILQIVRIKGNEKKVEEARSRVAELNDWWAKDEQEENKDNWFELLKAIQNRIFESESEKTKLADTIEQLKAGFQEEIQVIKNNFEEIHKDVTAIKENNPDLKLTSNDDVNNEEDTEASEADFYKFIDSDGYCNHFFNNRDDKPLHIASALGRLDIVQRLLKKGGSVNHKSKSGVAPLHRASQNGHLHVVKYLIEKGAYIDIQDKSGQAAIYLATINQHKDIVEYLCSQKAFIHLMVHSGYTALTYAQEGKYTEILQILKKYAS